MENDGKTEDRSETLRRRAYQIWENEGRPEGRHDEHWSQASQQDALDQEQGFEQPSTEAVEPPATVQPDSK